MKRQTLLEFVTERRGIMGTRICPYCGAYLDPGEKCDCRKEENEK